MSAQDRLGYMIVNEETRRVVSLELMTHSEAREEADKKGENIIAAKVTSIEP